MKEFRGLIILTVTSLLLFCVTVVFYHEEIVGGGDMNIDYLDVGQGDATLVTTPNDIQLLIDVGPYTKIVRSLEKVMRFYDKHINAILITHTDQDHVGGLLELLAYYSVDTIFYSSIYDDQGEIVQLTKEFIQEKELSTEIILVDQGHKIILDEKYNIYFDILYPFIGSQQKDKNDNSMVGRLVYGEQAFMFTGDASQEIEQELMRYFSQDVLKSSILQIGHHGSSTSTHLHFLKSVLPQTAVISSGKENVYGHPHQEVLDLLMAEEIDVYRTDTQNTISFVTDGVSYWLHE